MSHSPQSPAAAWAASVDDRRPRPRQRRDGLGRTQLKNAIIFRTA
jgi:hypothetical protein